MGLVGRYFVLSFERVVSGGLALHFPLSRPSKWLSPGQLCNGHSVVTGQGGSTSWQRLLEGVSAVLWLKWGASNLALWDAVSSLLLFRSLALSHSRTFTLRHGSPGTVSHTGVLLIHARVASSEIRSAGTHGEAPATTLHRVGLRYILRYLPLLNLGKCILCNCAEAQSIIHLVLFPGSGRRILSRYLSHISPLNYTELGQLKIGHNGAAL
jgi:hypothetical protein